MTPEDADLVQRLRGSQDPDLIMPCDEAADAIERLTAEKEAAEAETAEFVALTVTLTGRLERCKAEKEAAEADRAMAEKLVTGWHEGFYSASTALHNIYNTMTDRAARRGQS